MTELVSIYIQSFIVMDNRCRTNCKANSKVELHADIGVPRLLPGCLQGVRLEAAQLLGDCRGRDPDSKQSCCAASAVCGQQHCLIVLLQSYA